jgi:hypothetical protein
MLCLAKVHEIEIKTPYIEGKYASDSHATMLALLPESILSQLLGVCQHLSEILLKLWSKQVKTRSLVVVGACELDSL